MKTKYSIGDCLEIKNDYCNYVFCSNIVEIVIDKNNNIIYKLDNGKSVVESPKNDSGNIIVSKVGQLSTVSRENETSVDYPLTEQQSNDLEEAANTYADEHPGVCLENDGGVIDDYDKPKRDFMAGAKWHSERIIKNGCEYKRTQLIDKACEWLKDHVLEYFDDAGVDISTFTENFISAMKEE